MEGKRGGSERSSVLQADRGIAISVSVTHATTAMMDVFIDDVMKVERNTLRLLATAAYADAVVNVSSTLSIPIDAQLKSRLIFRSA